MNSLSLTYDHALVDKKQQSKDIQTLQKLFKKFADVSQQEGYPEPYSLINLPGDKKQLIQVKSLVDAKRSLKPALAIVVGIGGSNLGAQAIYQALFTTEAPLIPLYFADTVDPEAIGHIMIEAQQALEAGKNILVIAISKSGKTTETVANFECFLALLIKHRPQDYQKSVVVITDRDSQLWQLAEHKKCDRLAIPAVVGGRFSVLSSVGLFPLALAGVDIERLCAGAAQITPACVALDENNPALNMASILAYHYAAGVTIHDLFVFSIALEGLGKWQRQLIAESLGKPNEQGKPVGITPTVSVGSTDLHSVGQLYLGGPVARVTTFLWVEDPKISLCVPDMPEFDKLVPHLQKKSLHALMRAIFQGTQQAYQTGKCPFMTISMPEKNAFYIGQFLQMQMIATIYLGALLKINTFDQPQVELYKRNTRKILAHE